METLDQNKTPKQRGLRSPEYPIISLPEAIEKIKILWDNDKNNSIPSEAAFKHLGYQSTGGYAARVIAALKKYDLISENKGVIKLTEDAVDLILNDPDSDKYLSVVKKLALRPAIYERIYEDNNGCIPSDTTLKIKLIKEYKFNADKTEKFISTFKETMEFAGLIGDTTMQRAASLNPKTFVDDSELPVPKQPQEGLKKNPAMVGTIFPIPLSKRKQAAIAFETLPVEKKDIEAIKKWLELFEESLTEDSEN